MYHKKDRGKYEGQGIHRRQFFKGKCEARLEFPDTVYSKRSLWDIVSVSIFYVALFFFLSV